MNTITKKDGKKIMKKYQELKDEARNDAVIWQLEASEKNYSYSDYYMAGEYFHKIGKRYGLLKEFRENGIPC